MNEQFDFDVFLCHNSKDKPLIIKIADGLEQLELKPWIDRRNIDPGEEFQAAIEQAIPRTKSATIFFGLHGVGKWQKEEIDALYREKVNRKIILVPILLPGVNEIPSEFVFLQGHNYLKLETQEINEQFLNDLVRGVTRQNIELQNPTSATKLPPVNSSRELVQLIRDKMSLEDVKNIWFNTFDSLMKDQVSELTLGNCATELVVRAKQRNLTNQLINNIRSERPDLANDLNPY
ncbi:MAG: toll/interleukin-1 receptor domain-containing protein [Fischerella sp. CENA71]|nr:toll/interleukin-1 receptor domain-containing protein [Fischerella sp. CENA71]